MRYHNITKDDMLNGDGLRVVLWVSGCNHCCKECQNPITWDPNGGLLFDEAAKQDIFEQLDKNYISGITFSGGDPLHPQNVPDILKLVKRIRAECPGKDIWVWTGYKLDELNAAQMQVVDLINVLVDGKFVQDLKDPSLIWRGSSNQVVHHLR